MKTIEQLNDYFRNLEEWSDDYYMTNTDNPYAEYVSTGGYGDNLDECREKLLNEIEEEFDLTEEELQKIEAELNIKDAIFYFGSAEFYTGYSPGSDVCATPLGEVEAQIDDEIVEQLDGMTEEELKEIDFRGFRGHCSSGYIYYNYESYGWYLSIDKDSLIKSILGE